MTTTTTTAAVAAAYRDAHYWYTAQATHSDEYLAAVAARGLTTGQARTAGIGWAPGDGAALTDHLIRRGHRLPVLRDAGLSARRGPRHGDVMRDRVTFAYRRPGGGVAGFTARTTHDGAAKWVNTPSNAVFDKSRLLYGLHAIGPTARAVAVVEGAWDAATVTATTAGRIIGAAACGTRFTAAHAATITALGLPVIIATDADPAGWAAAARIHDALAAAGLTDTGWLDLEDGHDPASWHAAGHDLPAALDRVRPGSLTRMILASHADQLHPSRGPAAQLAWIRSHITGHLADLPAAQQADAITQLVTLTGLLPLTVADTLTAAARDLPQGGGRLSAPPPAPSLR